MENEIAEKTKVADRLKNLRKFIGFFVSIGVLVSCMHWHTVEKFAAISPFIERITYAFMGANILEHIAVGVFERLGKK